MNDLGAHGDWVAWWLGWSWQPEAFRILMGDLKLLPRERSRGRGSTETDGRTRRAELCQPPMTPDSYERVGGFARNPRADVPFGLPSFRGG